jgi:hypothetical protein
MDLEQLIDMSHPLARLGLFIDWQLFERTLGICQLVPFASGR